MEVEGKPRTAEEKNLLTIGMVNDMYAESRNDSYDCREDATQSDYDVF